MSEFLSELQKAVTPSRAEWRSHLKDVLAQLTAATHASLVDECLRQGLFRLLHELQLAMLPQPEQVPTVLFLFVRVFVCS